MLKKILATILLGLAVGAYADDNADSDQQYNDPTVSSLAASTQQFPSENNLTGKKGQKYNSSAQKATNKPLVNSMMYSGSQFPDQNKLTGSKGAKYNAPNSAKSNNPTVNSRMASSELFPDQDSFNNNGHTAKKTTASSAK